MDNFHQPQLKQFLDFYTPVMIISTLSMLKCNTRGVATIVGCLQLLQLVLYHMDMMTLQRSNLIKEKLEFIFLMLFEEVKRLKSSFLADFTRIALE